MQSINILEFHGICNVSTLILANEKNYRMQENTELILPLERIQVSYKMRHTKKQTSLSTAAENIMQDKRTSYMLYHFTLNNFSQFNAYNLLHYKSIKRYFVNFSSSRNARIYINVLPENQNRIQARRTN